MTRTRQSIVGTVGVLVTSSVLAAMVAIASAPVAADPAPANGQIAFQTSRDTGLDNIWLMNPDGTGQTRLTYAPGQHAGPAWSPDGTKIAFHSSRDDLIGGTHDIYVMDADGSNQIRLTDNPASDAWADWSPDGAKIVFTTQRDGNWEIYVMDADGTDQTRLTANTVTDDYPKWSPDGTKIAFSSNDAGDHEIYVMDADGTNRTQITFNSAADEKPAWSPDGTQIAYYSNEDGDHEIYVMNAGGTGKVKLTTTFRSTSPAWSPDGTKIAFASFASFFWQIFTMNADGSSQVNVTNSTGSNVHPTWGVVPTPDLTAPVVTITTPADGDVYTLGSTVTVDYACADEPDGSGLASCVGDAPDGTPLDTSAIGPGSFSVTGTDLAGNSATVTHEYSVFSVPDAPTIGTATAGNGQATVTWTAPTSNGGAAITGYVVTPYVGYFALAPTTFNSTATTQTVPGLINGITYRFRVQAINSIGVGAYSKVTNAVTPTHPTEPGAPTIGTAIGGNGQATVSWSVPASDGGSPIIGYAVTPYIGYFALTPRIFYSTATTQTVAGLTNGTTYRFRVQAFNAIGIGSYSRVTNSVTPAP